MKEDWNKWKGRGFVSKYVSIIAHDPWTAVGLPKVYRHDGWNLLDFMTTGVTASVFVNSLRGNPPSEAVVTLILMCHWMTMLGLSRLMSKDIASFVLMLTRMLPVRFTTFDAQIWATMLTC